MRLVIVKEDDVVVIDGEAYRVDCSNLPEDFHALMWDGNWGELEFTRRGDPRLTNRTNQPVKDIGPYGPYVDAWRRAKKRFQAQVQANEAWHAEHSRPYEGAEVQKQFEFVEDWRAAPEAVK